MVKGQATYEFDGFDVTITGATANFAGWYAEDQAQGWGTIGRTSTDQYYLDSDVIWGIVYIGDGSTITVFQDYYRDVDFRNVPWEVKNNATLYFGNCYNLDDKKTRGGIKVSNNYRISVSNGGKLYLYGCDIEGGAVSGNGESRVWGCLFDQCNFGLGNTDTYNLIINNGLFDCMNYEIGGTLDNINQWSTSVFLGATYDHSGSISNVNAKSLRILSTVIGNNWTGTLNLTNVESTSWLIDWLGDADTGVLWRKNTFNIKVSFENGSPMKNAKVSLHYYGQDGGLIGSWNTFSNGSIPEQILVVGFYNITGDDDLYSYDPYEIAIEKQGFDTYKQNFTLNEPTKLTVALSPTETHGVGAGGVVPRRRIPVIMFIEMITIPLWTMWIEKRISLEGIYSTIVIVGLAFLIRLLYRWFFKGKKRRKLRIRKKIEI